MSIFTEETQRYGVSNATVRNWEKLNATSSGRLTMRANKRKSKKRVVPLEYFCNKNNVAFVQDVLDYVDGNDVEITSAILSLGIALLRRAGIAETERVRRVLEDYADVAVVPELETMTLPRDEFDLLGLIYQSYLQEGKKNIIGSYYTPRKIARNMTKELDFSHEEEFFDPCCGSGAFLLATDAPNPTRLYGVDVDPDAVLCAKINLLVKYKDVDFTPQIYCLDYLMGRSFFQTHPVFEKKFDHIVTNPPWGAMEERCVGVDEITSKETFSYFFAKSYRQLKKNGVIRFLFPESVLNVKTHRDVRAFILDVAQLASITTYDDTFANVTTKYVDVECGRNAVQGTFNVNQGEKKRVVDFQTVYETANLNFNLLAEEDVEIVRIVKERGKYTLRDGVWALGIVTGDNKNKLFQKPCDGMEKIYTGKEIQPYTLAPAKNFIRYDRAYLQQVAKDEIYRAPEKLVYKFISNRLVFAYDDASSLFLNSANILIPSIPGMSVKTVMAFLNSTLFQFVYAKLFGEAKILKGNLIELPFPKITESENKKLSAFVDSVLNGETSKREEIDQFVFSLYGLTEKQIHYARSCVDGKVD